MTRQAKKYDIRVSETDSAFEMVLIKSSDDAAKFARRFYSDDISLYESAFIMLLNRANKVMGWAKISQGGITGTVVDVKIICKYAVDTLASGVILVHNHPSGRAVPSAEDTAIAKRLKTALSSIDSTLIDSIIITEESCYSMADEGNII